jgi:hypothetical protein
MRPVRRVHRGVIEPVCKSEPLTRWSKFVPIRRRVAAVQDGAKAKVAQIFGSDAGDVGLDELADLLLERHDPDQCGHPGLESRVGDECGPHGGPLIGMHHLNSSDIFGGRAAGSWRTRSYRHGESGPDGCRDDRAECEVFHCTGGIIRVTCRSTAQGPVGPATDCFDLHEEALTQDVVPVLRHGSGSASQLMTALSMNQPKVDAHAGASD